MSSLDHLLCPTTIDQPNGFFYNTYYSNQEDTFSSQRPSLDSKPNPRRCSVPECPKTAKRGGRCISHGGGNKCVIDGCNTSVVSRGLCVAHGGGKRCQTPECVKSAQSGGFCWVHGGGKKCGYHGCPKRAQSGGACIAHGGGKRCRIDGCSKVVQYDGLCVGHGGYRRCVVDICDRRAMANDYCQQHGGSSVCTLDQCYKRAVRGGMCSEHKTEASLQAATCNGLPTPSQSADNGRDRETKQTIYRPPTSEWRSRMDFQEFSPRSNQYYQMKNNSTRPPSAVNKVTRSPDGHSPITPTFSGLQNADTFPSFSLFTRKLNSADRYTRSHQLHQEYKIYPILPGIHALKNYQGKGLSSDEHTNTTWSKVEVSTDVNSKFRVVTEDQPRTAATTKNGYREDSSQYSDESRRHKFYVCPSYYKKNREVLECTTAQMHRYD